jgi:dihydrodipicolinate synthase/N-acetylneuraminate lyase
MESAAPHAVQLRGVLSVLCTPFADDGSIDEVSLRRLVDHQLAWGVDALVVFGLAGELYKLTDEERRLVLRTVVSQASGAVPVIAGAEHSGLEAAAMRGREAVALGADALMVYPPTFVKPDPQTVVDYYEAVADAAQVPIVIQDAPAWTGVPLPVELLLDLSRRSGYLRWVKIEAPPAAAKITSLADAGLHVFGGYGALHLAEDLVSGIEAVMPGCALPGLYRDIWKLHQEGDQEAAFKLYANALPLLAFQMSSLDIFVAVQKHLLSQIRILDSPRLRRPGRELDAHQQRWLRLLMARTQLSSYLRMPGAVPDGEELTTISPADR